VDLIGIEPMTSSMPWKRAPSCATGPLLSILKQVAGGVNVWPSFAQDSGTRTAQLVSKFVE
jgi:hypothetical protein